MAAAGSARSTRSDASGGSHLGWPYKRMVLRQLVHMHWHAPILQRIPREMLYKRLCEKLKEGRKEGRVTQLVEFVLSL